MTTLDFRGNIKGTETGPIRSKVNITTMLGPSVVQQEICLYDRVKRIDFTTKLKFGGPENYRVRMVMPTNIEGGGVWNEIPYGAVERDEGLYVAGNWIDYSESDYGVGLINKGIPANTVTEGNMTLTLLRSFSQIYLWLGRETLKPDEWEMHGRVKVGSESRTLEVPDALEIGREYDFHYSLYPHRGDWREGKTYKAAAEFKDPLRVVKVPVSKSDKILPEEWGLVEVAPDNLVLTVCKKAEEDGRIILRFYEAEGKDTKGRLRFTKPVKGAWLTNLLEDEEEEVKVGAGEIEIEVKPFEIVTLKVSLAG